MYGEVVCYGVMNARGNAGTKPTGLYIAIPCKRKPKLSGAGVKELPSADAGAIARYLRTCETCEGALLLDAKEVPKCNIVLATLREGLSDLLVCLTRNGDSFRPQRLVDWPKDGKLPVAERPGEFCGAMGNTTVYVLPDFNGDGVAELLVNSTSTYLFDLASCTGGKLREVHCTIYAPTR